jgi:hypothetical protein
MGEVWFVRGEGGNTTLNGSGMIQSRCRELGSLEIAFPNYSVLTASCTCQQPERKCRGTKLVWFRDRQRLVFLQARYQHLFAA